MRSALFCVHGCRSKCQQPKSGTWNWVTYGLWCQQVEQGRSRCQQMQQAWQATSSHASMVPVTEEARVLLLAVSRLSGSEAMYQSSPKPGPDICVSIWDNWRSWLPEGLRSPGLERFWPGGQLRPSCLGVCLSADANGHPGVSYQTDHISH